VYSVMLMEEVSSTPTLVGCAVNSPATCSNIYGQCVILKDGSAATGGSQIGCLKLVQAYGGFGNDQACPAGFKFHWYTNSAPGTAHVPALKECWVSNGGNSNW
jgi:hypothetical protein